MTLTLYSVAKFWSNCRKVWENKHLWPIFVCIDLARSIYSCAQPSQPLWDFWRPYTQPIYQQIRTCVSLCSSWIKKPQLAGTQDHDLRQRQRCAHHYTSTFCLTPRQCEHIQIMGASKHTQLWRLRTSTYTYSIDKSQVCINICTYNTYIQYIHTTYMFSYIHIHIHVYTSVCINIHTLLRPMSLVKWVVERISGPLKYMYQYVSTQRHVRITLHYGHVLTSRTDVFRTPAGNLS